MQLTDLLPPAMELSQEWWQQIRELHAQTQEDLREERTGTIAKLLGRGYGFVATTGQTTPAANVFFHASASGTRTLSTCFNATCVPLRLIHRSRNAIRKERSAPEKASRFHIALNVDGGPWWDRSAQRNEIVEGPRDRPFEMIPDVT